MNSSVKCGKCLLSQFDSRKFVSTVEEYISVMPPEMKVSEDEYNRRLRICLECDMLLDGLCGECGCFVEVRAAKKNMSCPHCEHKW